MAANIEVVWEEPPAAVKKTQASTQALIDALGMLKSRPNTWARIGVWTGESGAYGAKRRLTELNAVPGKFEWRIVTKYGENEKGSALYARYIPK